MRKCGITLGAMCDNVLGMVVAHKLKLACGYGLKLSLHVEHFRHWYVVMLTNFALGTAFAYIHLVQYTIPCIMLVVQIWSKITKHFPTMFKRCELE